jgi:hypothetical protein
MSGVIAFGRKMVVVDRTAHFGVASGGLQDLANLGAVVG